LPRQPNRKSGSKWKRQMIGCRVRDARRALTRIGEGVAAADTAGWPVADRAGRLQSNDESRRLRRQVLMTFALERETPRRLPPKAATPFFRFEKACRNMVRPAGGIRGGSVRYIRANASGRHENCNRKSRSSSIIDPRRSACAPAPHRFGLMIGDWSLYSPPAGEPSTRV